MMMSLVQIFGAVTVVLFAKFDVAKFIFLGKQDARILTCGSLRCFAKTSGSRQDLKISVMLLMQVKIFFRFFFWQPKINLKQYWMKTLLK